MRGTTLGAGGEEDRCSVITDVGWSSEEVFCCLGGEREGEGRRDRDRARFGGGDRPLRREDRDRLEECCDAADEREVRDLRDEEEDDDFLRSRERRCLEAALRALPAMTAKQTPVAWV